MTNTLTWVEHLWLFVVWTFPLAGVCIQWPATCLLSGHLLWLESGCLVLGANMKHVENKTCLWSGHLLWLESGCLVLDTNMKHVENKTCLLSGHLLWLESGCLVLGANMKHVENKTCLLSGHLLWLESGCLVLGANMKHVQNKTYRLFGHLAAGCIQWPTHHATSAVISLLSGYLFWLESRSLVLGACMQPASRQQGAEFIGWLKGERQCLTHPGNIAYNWWDSESNRWMLKEEEFFTTNGRGCQMFIKNFKNSKWTKIWGLFKRKAVP